MGVNIDRVVALTFLLGGILAGAAGFLFGIFFEAARFNIGFLPGIKAFTAAVLGGIGNIRGALRRRPAARAARELRLDRLRRPVEGRVRLRRAGAGAAVPSQRSARREPREVQGMTSVRSRIRLPKLQIVEPVGRTLGPAALVGQVARVHRDRCALAWWYPTTLDRNWQSVLFFPVGVYILLALGLNVVVGLTGLLDLGYVAFFAVGAYTTAKLTTDGGSLTAWEALLLAIVGGDGGRRDARRARPCASGATTSPSSRSASARSCGSRPRTARSLGEARGISGIPHPSAIGNTEFGTKPLPYYYLVLVAIVIVILLVARLQALAGRALVGGHPRGRGRRRAHGRADLQDEAVVVRHGRRDRRPRRAGSTPPRSSFINPATFPFTVSILILAAVVLGGLGSTPGVIAGAFAVGFLPSTSATPAATARSTS